MKYILYYKREQLLRFSIETNSDLAPFLSDLMGGRNGWLGRSAQLELQ
jgi:hypothetical protein